MLTFWLKCILIAAAFAVPWYLLYRLCCLAEHKIAAHSGREPAPDGIRTLFLSTGILFQILLWFIFIWAGASRSR